MGERDMSLLQLATCFELVSINISPLRGFDLEFTERCVTRILRVIHGRDVRATFADYL